MLILPRLEVPQPPLLYENDSLDIKNINGYLQNLVGYFYSCNALLADSVLGIGEGGAKYNEGSFTFNTTGFISNPTGTAYYVQSGKQTTIVFPQILGGSNATTFTIENIPTNLFAPINGFIPVPAYNNGLPVNGIIFASNTSSWPLFPDYLAGPWIAASTKGILACFITYRSV